MYASQNQICFGYSLQGSPKVTWFIAQYFNATHHPFYLTLDFHILLLVEML